jgi:hypothetical protein
MRTRIHAIIIGGGFRGGAIGGFRGGAVGWRGGPPADRPAAPSLRHHHARGVAAPRKPPPPKPPPLKPPPKPPPTLTADAGSGTSSSTPIAAPAWRCGRLARRRLGWPAGLGRRRGRPRGEQLLPPYGYYPYDYG